MKNVFWYTFVAGLTLNLTGTIEWDWYLVIAPLLFGAVTELAIAMQTYRIKKTYQKARLAWLEDSRKATERSFRIPAEATESLGDHKRRVAKHIKNR